MPVFISPIQNAYRAIDKPIVDQVINGLIADGIIPRPEIYVHTDKLYSQQKAVTMYVRYPGEFSLTVEPITEMVDQADWTLKNRWQYMPTLMEDHALRVSLMPMLVDYQTTVRLIYTDDNLEHLRHLHEALLIKRNLGWYGSSHTVDYTIIPSKETDELLRTIHSMREQRYGYGETYDEWLTVCSSPDLHPVQGGRHVEQAYNIRQIHIEGNIEGDIEPIEEYTTNVFSFVLTYKFRYSRPSALVAKYPIQVHQQLLPRHYTITANSEHKGLSIAEVPIVRALTQVSDVYPPTIRIPSVDLEPIQQHPTGYLPLWTAMLMLDDTPLLDQVLCVIDQVPDVVMHPDIIAYLKDNRVYPNITRFYKAPFLLALYKDTTLMDERFLTVDAELAVRLTSAVNKRSIYRIALCVLVDQHALAAEAIPPINDHDINALIADTVNYCRARHYITSPTGVVIPKDLTSIGYLRSVAPLLTTWLPDGTSVRERKPYGVATQRTVMDTWVSAERK